jgi:hypothetical protein
MLRLLSSKVHAEIAAVVEEAKKARALIHVYAEAEKIRKANLTENIALEDIAEELIKRAGDGPGYEADPLEALQSLLGSEVSYRVVH